MSEPAPTETTSRTSPRRTIRLAYALAVIGVVQLIAYALVGEHLPWWGSALLLAGAAIASLEAVHLARKAGAA